MHLWTRDWLCRRPQSGAYATLLQELDRNEYKNILGRFFRISCQISMCICLHLPVLILLVDSDWLISIKVGQSLTGNRSYFYLRQSWSNFDQVRQSGVYIIKVSKPKFVKMTWSNFDSVNRLLHTKCAEMKAFTLLSTNSLRLICAFVVRIWQKHIFSWRGSFQCCPHVHTGPTHAPTPLTHTEKTDVRIFWLFSTIFFGKKGSTL